MTTSRLAILLAVLLAGMSTVFLLPQQMGVQPVGIELELPEYVGEWYGRELKVSEVEQSVLGEETEFSRKLYTNGRGDDLQVSVVLGGHDMNTSIHRPERCLPAQGWTVTNKTNASVRLPGKGLLRATRLYNVRNIVGPDEKPFPLYSVNYYWFTGHTDSTGSHFERTLIDARDRLMNGYNQRWAYITVAGTVTEKLRPFGRSEREVDALVKDFIKQLTPMLHKETVDHS